jgi:trehalose-phosphatase
VRATVGSLPGLRVEEGKKVVELRPDVDWDKGKAVLWLIETLGWDGALPIHLGDDATDETVFAALEGRGVGIFVGTEDRSTAASLRLRDSEEVGAFLDRFAARLQARR